MAHVLPALRAADNTVWNRMSIINRFDLLREIAAPLQVVYEVRLESLPKQRVASALQTAIIEGWVTPVVISEYSTLKLFTRLTRVVDVGEAASIAYLVGQGGGCFITDDMRAYRTAVDNKQTVVSSLWILHQAVQRGLASPDDADRYLGIWGAAYKMPAHANTYNKIDVLFRTGIAVNDGGLF